MRVMAYTSAQKARVSSSEVQYRVRAIEEIARQRLVGMPSTIEWDIEARRVIELVSWILQKLRAVHKPLG